MRDARKAEDEAASLFPDFKALDHVKLCPRFAAILQRSEEEGVGEEELDVLQLELEDLLSNVSKRMRLLETETQALNSWPDNGDLKSIISSSGNKKDSSKSGGKLTSAVAERELDPAKLTSTGSPGKRGKLASSIDEKCPKRSKGSPCPPPAHIALPVAPTPPPSTLLTPALPVNETPTKFWALVEPFCADISNGDVKFLEDMIRAIEQDDEWKAWSEKWAVEDMQTSNSKEADHSAEKQQQQLQTQQRLAEIDLENPEVSGTLGQLAQRLVCAFIDECPDSFPALDGPSDTGPVGAAGNPAASPAVLARSLGLGSLGQLEKRIKRELFDLGIFDKEDYEATEEGPGDSENSGRTHCSQKEDNEDEVIKEMRRIQAELKEVNEKNLEALKSLVKKAKDEMIKQELKKKLGQADNEVMECFRKMQDCHHKKRPPTKKEKEACFRSVATRDSIVKQLDKFK